MAPCRWADGPRAIYQEVAPGVGKPMFGKPHHNRQRQAIVDAQKEVGKSKKIGTQGYCQIANSALNC